MRTQSGQTSDSRALYGYLPLTSSALLAAFDCFEQRRFLVLLIGITLKINDEFSFTLGKGGVEDFADWPWVDEALVVETYKALDNQGV